MEAPMLRRGGEGQFASHFGGILTLPTSKSFTNLQVVNDFININEDRQNAVVLLVVWFPFIDVEENVDGPW